jgi:hypothetical protein
LDKKTNEYAVGDADYQQNVFLGLFASSAAAGMPNRPYALHYSEIEEAL